MTDAGRGGMRLASDTRHNRQAGVCFRTKLASANPQTQPALTAYLFCTQALALFSIIRHAICFIASGVVVMAVTNQAGEGHPQSAVNRHQGKNEELIS